MTFGDVIDNHESDNSNTVQPSSRSRSARFKTLPAFPAASNSGYTGTTEISVDVEVSLLLRMRSKSDILMLSTVSTTEVHSEG